VKGHVVAAEALGTFLLVFIGPGAAAVNAWSPGSVGPVGIALAFGLTIAAAVYALGEVSGAHFNPAVTAGFWMAGRLPRDDVLPYVGAQLIGAVSAAVILRLVLGPAARAAATVARVSAVSAVTVEVVLTFLLVLVVLTVAADSRVTGPMGGVIVGITVACDALMGGPLTGASMNPARSLGPAVATATWGGHWIYWVGPLAGAALAVGAQHYLQRARSQ
jgi:aquaporin Z